jgi:hypothetical protein
MIDPGTDARQHAGECRAIIRRVVLARQCAPQTRAVETSDPAANFDECALGKPRWIAACGLNERPRALCCGNRKHKIGALLFGGRARELYRRPRGWERLRSVPEAVCSEVLPSRNQTVALRAPDSSFLKKWDRLFRRPHSPSKKEFSNCAVAISGRWASQARKLSNVALRPQCGWRGEGPRPSRVILSFPRLCRAQRPSAPIRAP